MPKHNLEWLAYDIACDKDKSFRVYVPDYGDEWVVDKIGYGASLGNFIIIKSGQLRIVYGHTYPNYLVQE